MSKDKDVETVFISNTDDYSNCLKESISNKDKEKRRPKGHVKVFSVNDNREIDPKNFNPEEEADEYIGSYECTNAVQKEADDGNLIVYKGREWLASAIFNVDNDAITATADEKVYWLGLGTGGSTEDDPFNPILPTNEDTELDEPIMLNEADSAYADYRTAPWTEGYYKKPFESVEFEQDEYNDDAYLVAKITIVITSADANSDGPVNEAGLFSASSSAGGYNGNFTLFSRVSFPSVIKNENRQLVFVWYIYT